MHTGDGIQSAPQKLGSESHPAPHGGEGGSVLQALGSKEWEREARAKRRRQKKEDYAGYLKSETWGKIRRAALARDKNVCRACSGRARVVHHIRYPKHLGEEKMEWLYSLCASCHDEIHRLAGQKGFTLRQATNQVLNRSSKTVILEDDWRLSRSATRNRQLKKTARKGRVRRIKPAHIADNRRKKSKLVLENERLHEIQRRNRERREAA